MNNNNPKMTKKSIRFNLTNRIDIFLLLVILVIIISTVTVNLVKRSEVKSRQVTLLLSLQSGELLGKGMMEELLQEFNELNPDIRLRLQGEGEVPHILIFDEGDFCALVAANALTELRYFYIQDYEDRAGQDNEDDSFTPMPQFLTPLLAVPLVSFMDMLFYNIEILSAAGFSHPPKTRDEVISCVRAVSRGNFPGVSGAAFNLSPDDRQALSRDIFSWIWASGGNFWPDDRSPPVLNTHSANADFTFFGSVNRELQISAQAQNRPGVFERTGSRQVEEFAQGKLALMIASTRVIPYLKERLGDNVFGLTTIPVSGTGGRYNISLSSVYAGINSGGSFPNDAKLTAAWQFIKFLSEKSPLFCAEFKAIPGSVSNVIPGDYVRDDPLYSKAWDIYGASQVVHGFSGKPGGQEYERVFYEELRNFFEGSRTSMQASVAIQQRWKEITESREKPAVDK